MTAVRAPASVLASVFAAHLLLIGAAAVEPAVAEDQAPVANKTDGEAGPIDTRIIPQRPAHLGRDHETHDWKKSSIIHSSGYSGNHRIWFRGARSRVMRNAIGQPVHHDSSDFHGAEVKARERSGVDGVRTTEDRARSGGTGAGGIDPRGQGFVPVREGGSMPYDPRVSTATNRSSISGHDVVRPGSSTSVIGGPAKNLAGVINGTTFHHRHR